MDDILVISTSKAVCEDFYNRMCSVLKMAESKTVIGNRTSIVVGGIKLGPSLKYMHFIPRESKVRVWQPRTANNIILGCEVG